jgi:hypothetical protein
MTDLETANTWHGGARFLLNTLGIRSMQAVVVMLVTDNWIEVVVKCNQIAIARGRSAGLHPAPKAMARSEHLPTKGS